MLDVYKIQIFEMNNSDRMFRKALKPVLDTEIITDILGHQNAIDVIKDIFNKEAYNIDICNNEFYIYINSDNLFADGVRYGARYIFKYDGSELVQVRYEQNYFKELEYIDLN